MLAALFLLCAATATAQEPVFKIYGGANAVWFNVSDEGPVALPSDFELGGNARASLSPHISFVSSVYFGMDHSYVRGTGGLRVTATDVNDPNFSIGLGIQYQASSEPDLRPEELAPDVSIGWKPWPETRPELVVGAQGGYGLDSGQAHVLLALRYYIGKL
jgi:hypothetical protein